MNAKDAQFWRNWKYFADATEYRAFRAWAIEGSCIEQRMGMFDDVPESWHKIKLIAMAVENYEDANKQLRKGCLR